jgi:uncharacterized repeat protein (TIGR03803 family)
MQNIRPSLVGIRWLAAAAGLIALAAGAQTVEKVADLNFSSNDGIGQGGYAPLDRFTQVGTNLWFTTSKGGTFDAGTVSRFNLVTREVEQVASLDNVTGKAPESSLLIIGEEGYFTTVNGGAGNRGTIARIHLETGQITPIYDFPSTGDPTGQTPRGGLTPIGEELWMTTSSGGSSNRGTIVRYNLTNGQLTLVTNLDGPLLGGQAFSGLAPGPSNTWYFTTFTGGDTFGTTGLTLGAGTLGRLSFDEQGEPVVSRVASLAAGHTQFPATEPLSVGDDAIYFTTTGPNSSPGALVRYQPSTGAWSNLYSFTTNTAELAALGSRPGYSGLVEWLGELYFINRLGGMSNLGAVVKFNITSNTVTKLADLRGNSSESLGSASGFFGTGTIVEEQGRFYLYYPLTSGGAFNRGTIIRVVLPPPPIALTISPVPGQERVKLDWAGGYPPFTVESASIGEPGVWSEVLPGTTDRTLEIPMSPGGSFFRVQGAL